MLLHPPTRDSTIGGLVAPRGDDGDDDKHDDEEEKEKEEDVMRMVAMVICPY